MCWKITKIIFKIINIERRLTARRLHSTRIRWWWSTITPPGFGYRYEFLTYRFAFCCSRDSIRNSWNSLTLVNTRQSYTSRGMLFGKRSWEQWLRGVFFICFWLLNSAIGFHRKLFWLIDLSHIIVRRRWRLTWRHRQRLDSRFVAFGNSAHDIDTLILLIEDHSDRSVFHCFKLALLARYTTQWVLWPWVRWGRFVRVDFHWVSFIGSAVILLLVYDLSRPTVLLVTSSQMMLWWSHDHCFVWLFVVVWSRRKITPVQVHHHRFRVQGFRDKASWNRTFVVYWCVACIIVCVTGPWRLRLVRKPHSVLIAYQRGNVSSTTIRHILSSGCVLRRNTKHFLSLGQSVWIVISVDCWNFCDFPFQIFNQIFKGLIWVRKNGVNCHHLKKWEKDIWILHFHQTSPIFS